MVLLQCPVEWLGLHLRRGPRIPDEGLHGFDTPPNHPGRLVCSLFPWVKVEIDPALRIRYDALQQGAARPVEQHFRPCRNGDRMPFRAHDVGGCGINMTVSRLVHTGLPVSSRISMCQTWILPPS